RRAIRIQHFDFSFDQARNKFAQISNHSGATNKLQLASIKPHDTAQPTKNVAKMAAENATINIEFVQHDIAQILEQARPAHVIRQDSGVQHVRIHQNHIAFFADGFACIGEHIAVVNENPETVSEPLIQIIKFRKLVLRESFD